jgi:MSHA pilin protein MshD
MCITDAGFRGRGRQSGLSLVELVVAIVVLAVGLAAMLIAITNATRSGGDPLANKQTIAIAEAMLEEIELKPFNTGTFAGPYNCGTRPQFDAVFPDYNNYAAAAVCDMTTGLPIAFLNGYNTTVTLTPTAIGGIPAANAYLITVKVTSPGGYTVSLSGFRSSYF